MIVTFRTACEHDKLMESFTKYDDISYNLNNEYERYRFKKMRHSFGQSSYNTFLLLPMIGCTILPNNPCLEC